MAFQRVTYGAFKPAPFKATVAVADLEKLDIRVGTILSVEVSVRRTTWSREAAASKG